MIVQVTVTRTLRTTIEVGVEIFGTLMTLQQIRDKAIEEITDKSFDRDGLTGLKSYTFSVHDTLDLGTVSKLSETQDFQKRCSAGTRNGYFCCEMREGHDGDHRYVLRPAEKSLRTPFLV